MEMSQKSYYVIIFTSDRCFLIGVKPFDIGQADDTAKFPPSLPLPFSVFTVLASIATPTGGDTASFPDEHTIPE